MKNKRLIGIISKILVLIAVFIIGFYAGTQNSTLTNVDDSGIRLANKEVDQTVSVIFDFGNEEVKIFPEFSYRGEKNVFEIISGVTSANNLEFSYKDYGGDLGVFIESINGVGTDEGDKWWQFWVNKEYSEVGVSNFMVSSGDVIEFKFIESQLEF